MCHLHLNAAAKSKTFPRAQDAINEVRVLSSLKHPYIVPVSQLRFL